MLAAAVTLAATVPAHATAAPGFGFETWLNFRSSNGQWDGWQALGDDTWVPGGIGTMFAVNDNFNDTLHLDNYNENGTLWDNVRHTNGTWQGWEPAPTAPDHIIMMRAAALPDGDIEYLAADSNGWMYESTRSSSGPWSSWSAAFAIPQLGDFAATADANGNVQVILTNDNAAVYHNLQYTDGAWQGLQKPTQPTGGGAIAVAAAGMPNGDVQFMAYNGLNLYHDIRYNDGTWQGWEETKQPPAGWVSTTSPSTWDFNQLWGTADAYGNTQWIVSSTENQYTGSPTRLYHTVRYADGSWQSSGWGQLPSPPEGACGNVSIASPTYTSGSDYGTSYVLAQCAVQL
jgi:hypothetical protein